MRYSPGAASCREKPPAISDVAEEAGAPGPRRNSTFAKATARPFSSAIFPLTPTSAAAAQERHNATVRTDMERIERRMCPLGTVLPLYNERAIRLTKAPKAKYQRALLPYFALLFV